MAKLNQKQTLLVIAGVTVLLCGASGGGVYWAQGLIEEEKQQIEAKERDIAAARKKIKKIPRVEDDVIVLRENVAEHVRILPEEAELTEFTRTVQKFAIKAGISIDRFVPVRGAAKGGVFRRVTYQYFFKATLWQFMKFMNFFETYRRFASVRDFNLTAGKQQKAGADLAHSIRMTIATYVYDPKSSGTLVTVPNYAQKVKRLATRIAAESVLRLDRDYNYVGREGRRDIFVDPRQKDTGDEHSVASIEQQRELIEEFSAKLQVLRQKWERSTSPDTSMFERIELKGKVITSLQEVEQKINEIAENKMITNPALNARWYKEVQMPHKELSAKLRKERGEDYEKYLSVEDFKKLIKGLTDQLAQGGLETAITTYNSMTSKLDVPRDDPRFPLRIKVESLIHKAKVATEFSSIPLVITGVVVAAAGKSGVILNGEVYEEGEYITQNLFVRAVRQEEIEFVYKGFSLVKTF